MADTTIHTETHAAPEVDAAAAAPATHHAEEKVDAAAAEDAVEATFSTQVEPSDAPVLNADNTLVETAVVEEGATAEPIATSEGEETAANSAPASSGSDKKSKSWIAKLTNNFKKLADKKPKTEKATETSAATGDEVPAAAAAAETEGDVQAEAAATETSATVEETPAASAEAEAETPVAATTEHAEDKPSATEATDDTLSAPKIGKRLSFNFFKKSNKADKEKEKAAAIPAPVEEAEETTEAEAAADADAIPADETAAKEGEDAAAPSAPVKDHTPAIEAAPIPAELAVEETAVTAVH